MERKLTEGSIFKNILIFSLPFLLSFFLQTLYGLADLYIIGQFCSTEATTAVSIGSQVMHLFTVVIVGLAMGSTVLIATAVGADDKKLRNKAIGNSFVIFLLLSVVFTVVLQILVPSLCQLMMTPVDAIPGLTSYLRVCFAGIPFIVMYNVISSILRGMGDSKSPMYFIAIACVFNIVFDYIFIGNMNMGPLGAALGTCLAQAVSVCFSLTFLIKKQLISGLEKNSFSLDNLVWRKIFRVGTPIAAQDFFIQIAFILITVFANRRGLNDSAAVGIVEKIIGILFLIPSTLLSTVSTICAQNIGAGLIERAKKTLYSAIIITVCSGILFSIVFQFKGAIVVGLFTKDSQVILLGTQYLKSYVWDCLFAGVHFMFSGFFCAISKSELSFIHNIISALCVRIPLSYYFSVKYVDSLFPMGMAAPAGSIVSVVICIIAYLLLVKKLKNQIEDK